MAAITIYHNPRCSKSRSALHLLEEKGVRPTVIEYLKTPPTAQQLRDLLHKLGLTAEQIVRKSEDIYKTRYAGHKHTEDEWIQALTEHPSLIERPIVVHGDRAVIGRPPEKVLDLL